MLQNFSLISKVFVLIVIYIVVGVIAPVDIPLTNKLPNLFASVPKLLDPVFVGSKSPTKIAFCDEFKVNAVVLPFFNTTSPELPDITVMSEEDEK